MSDKASGNSLDNLAPSLSPQRQHRLMVLKRLSALALFVVIVVLLVILVKNLQWQEVKRALLAYSSTTLMLGLAVGLASYLVFSSFDILGRSYTRHRLPARKVMPVAFVCYAFNLNLTSWVGGVAMRYRLYSRLGLSLSTITKVLSLSVFTNCLGYIIVAGVIFSLRLVTLPASWHLSATLLQWLGIGLLLIALAYLAFCALARRRTWQVLGHELTLPSLPLALAQAFLATLNWVLMALLIFLLLPAAVSYSAVLGILLISGIAGMIAQIPAGLGVLETVFIGVLQHQLPKESIVAALIGYRAIYFLLPLAIAFVIYLLLEGKAGKWALKAR